jgi:hypothetical protein
VYSITPTSTPTNQETSLTVVLTSYNFDNDSTDQNIGFFVDIRISQQEWFSIAISIAIGILLGLILWKVRSNSNYNEKIVHFEFYKYFIVFVLNSVSVVTNISALLHMIKVSHSPINAILLILCFVYDAILSLSVVIMAFFYDDQFSLYMEGSILYEQSRVFSLLCFISIILGPLVLIFLPWKTSKFSLQSGGFPTLSLYRVLM